MRKVYIHTETITKPLEKFPFQIRLPKVVNNIASVRVSVDYPISPTGDDIARDAEAGDIWLSIPSDPEYFYTETVRLTDNLSERLRQITSPGISVGQEQWIQTSNPKSFFKLNLNRDAALIEGFYEGKVNWNYTLKIYLEFDE